MLSMLQAARMDSAFNGAGDTYPGGTSEQFAPGMLGTDVFYTDAQARQLPLASGLTITQLRAGWYKRVQTKAGSSASPAAGKPAYFTGTINEFGQYVVSPDPVGNLALGYYLGSVTKGNYCWIQTAGIVHGLYGTVTKGTPAIGDVVVLGSGVLDVLADATALTSGNFQTVVGRALEAAASSSVKKIWIAAPPLGLV